ncbi:biotin-dependent carboxyltransferase family protein [Paenibacillus sp. MSJ-34]|uniref:5-oxoprolinase subunit C family protein n=1 Tax=Paenibacillus sp. MSJ-34 TaxID=2841529 RepID=UPI001C120D4C|nr:biotin-dependent carboxyltransferase family protein [Paenibacillus sp. MSJ-34]MBU5442976.1 biotin-dependent carboxyltransferase family protein [Paenibacillus sp. MSJ-34]
MSVTVLRPGLLTSIQDAGRYGYRKFGLPVGGAMDPYSLRIANLLVGNDEREAALEATLIGPALRFEQDALLAVAGGDLSPTVDGMKLPMWRPVIVKSGSVLRFGPCKSGCRAYVAVAGGFRIPEVMGSKSTYLRGGIGGFHGRALQEGDVIGLNAPEQARSVAPAAFDSLRSTAWFAGWNRMPHHSEHITVRAMRGDHYAHFDDDSRLRFFDRPFQVEPQSDRMGCRLSGSRLQLAEPIEVISEAVAVGTVQAPPDGHPIVLLADSQTIGGYPRIAQIAAADLPLIAQAKPGTRIRFQEISVREAERLYRLKEYEIRIIRAGIRMKRLGQKFFSMQN